VHPVLHLSSIRVSLSRAGGCPLANPFKAAFIVYQRQHPLSIAFFDFSAALLRKSVDKITGLTFLSSVEI
jgi:hypothetical protein